MGFSLDHRLVWLGLLLYLVKIGDFGICHSLPLDWQINFKKDDFEIIFYTCVGIIIQFSCTYPEHFCKDFTKKMSFSQENIKTGFWPYLMTKCPTGH